MQGDSEIRNNQRRLAEENKPEHGERFHSHTHEHGNAKAPEGGHRREERREDVESGGTLRAKGTENACVQSRVYSV